MRRFILASCAGFGLLITPAIAAEFPPAGDLVYEINSIGGAKSTSHQMSDGKGHVRTEVTSSGSNSVNILDSPNKVTIVLMPAQKKYMKVAYKEQAGAITDEASAKRAKAKLLGTKVISGHPCHGYEATTKSGDKDVVSTTWIGDDIKNLVKSETNTPNGKVTMELKSYKPNTASAEKLLEIPAGYTELKMPGMH